MDLISEGILDSGVTPAKPVGSGRDEGALFGVIEIGVLLGSDGVIADGVARGCGRVLLLEEVAGDVVKVLRDGSAD